MLCRQSHLTPRQIVPLLRGFLKGRDHAGIDYQGSLSYQTVLNLRRAIQSNAQAAQLNTPLRDRQTEIAEHGSSENSQISFLQAKPQNDYEDHFSYVQYSKFERRACV